MVLLGKVNNEKKTLELRILDLEAEKQDIIGLHQEERQIQEKVLAEARKRADLQA